MPKSPPPRPCPDDIDPIARALRRLLQGVLAHGLPPEELQGVGWASKHALELVKYRKLTCRIARGRPQTNLTGGYKLTPAGALVEIGGSVAYRPEDYRALTVYYLRAAGGYATSREMALWLDVSHRTARGYLKAVGAHPRVRGYTWKAP